MTTIEFSAPWGHTVRVRTILWIAVLTAVMLAAFVAPAPLPLTLLLLGLPPLIFAAALAARVRGYVLAEDAITVRRGVGETRLPLAGLRSVTAQADAMRHWPLVLLGNQGFLSITGRCWSKRLGWYRAFVTDRSRAVVLRYADRTILISPHDPQQFIMRAGTFIRIAGFTGRSSPD
ncbi:MAG TPA: PH domain-containing protein [Steroidobacteraceae bacterium]|nr:PH domain-containing protein [Steroidobacteraceae bacterium]